MREVAMSFNIRLLDHYQNFTLDVDIALPAQGVTALFGPSGSGKTNLLRAIAGLHKTDQGRVTFNSHVWQSEQQFVKAHLRPIGYVFQESSLFDHMTVRQILDFGLKRSPKALSPLQQDHVIELLGISHLFDRKPYQLSGGERQRVAIATALLPAPELLLMDEPMASLDFDRKKEILGLLIRLKADLKIPLLYVSHDIDEVTRLADHIILLSEGRVEQQGPLRDVLSHHKTLNRMGHEPFSLLFGRVVTTRNDYNLMDVQMGDILLKMPSQDVPERQKVVKGQEIRLHLYAKDVSLTLTKPHHTSILNILECEVIAIDPPSQSGQCLVHLGLGDIRLGAMNFQANVSALSCEELSLTVGLKLFAQIKAVSIVQ